MVAYLQRKRLMVAIDGTAGAGKTTIGQMLATHLDCAYLDTGAMYRAVALLAMRAGFGTSDALHLTEIARDINFESRDASPIEALDGRQYTVLLNGEDVSEALRSPAVEANVSQVAAIPNVRTELVKKQRWLATQADRFVMIGRDIGSVVLPDADLKIYLDASPEVRAQRRSQQTTGSSQVAQQFITQRDYIDSRRSISPLVVVEDALYINTDELSKEQVLERVLSAANALLR
jgi:cytidylate kinase